MGISQLSTLFGSKQTNATLYLGLVHYKEVIVSTVLKVFSGTVLETHFFILTLMQGEEWSRKSTVTFFTSQGCQREFL